MTSLRGAGLHLHDLPVILHARGEKRILAEGVGRIVPASILRHGL
jgi:hypothetical protein